LQQNFITKIENLQDLTQLEVLDIAYNKVQVIEGLESQKLSLKELWLNWNVIDDESSLGYLSNLVNIETVYIADNPVVKQVSNVQDLILKVAPKIKQIDGNILRNSPPIKVLT
jgi:protein phosphatase 1 regulatory subunit 7